MCPSNDDIETTEHSLLPFSSFEVECRNLVSRMFELLQPFGPDLDILIFQVWFRCNFYFMKIKDLPYDLNRNILELILQCIHTTCRFDQIKEKLQ